ncbi:MAG: peptidase M61, partial [Bacteroidota bacterium]
KALDVTQQSKNTWQVATNGATEVTVNYRVYAFELSVRTSFLDASHAVVNGTSVFFYVDGQVDQPVTLEVRPDPSWKTVSTGLRNKEGATWEFEAVNYDELVDCPLEIGNHEVLTFSASGVQHEVAMVGRAEYDAEKITVDMAKVVDACTGVFGENPNANYTFIVLNGANRGGGLEHRNSTTLKMNRWAYRDGYKGFLGLVAHEYFHLWNVKRMRPKALGPFDYENENYSRLLWVMEGFTSYYDEHLLHRAGFYTDEEYLQKVTSGINAIENQPGNLVQPVAQSSFNAWIKAYRPDENSRNVTISYYTKGGVVATLLNLEIMQATKGEKDLDDLMRYLYDTYYKRMDRGFTDAEMLQAVETVAGKKMGAFFDRFV